MNILTVYQPNQDPPNVLTLNFVMEEHMELPVVWLTTNVLQEIWNLRKEKKRCILVRVRAYLKARVSLLRKCIQIFLQTYYAYNTVERRGNISPNTIQLKSLRHYDDSDIF